MPPATWQLRAGPLTVWGVIGGEAWRRGRTGSTSSRTPSASCTSPVVGSRAMSVSRVRYISLTHPAPSRAGFLLWVTFRAGHEDGGVA